ncbi:hypothetical protein A2635_04495 [Candidatus Peribacteria bacterium RIFCSPHIGHO2_01_FULL_51_9]|nr:MAG: hypothetical protein A2635_04495 [Candidatus Peribacteria bacterium RIFCSPHIGHO2_01_FULL_51_9]
MLEYIEVFLNLGRKTEDPGTLYQCLLVLKTVEGYMDKEQWKIYQLLQGRYDEQKKEAQKGRYR